MMKHTMSYIRVLLALALMLAGGLCCNVHPLAALALLPSAVLFERHLQGD
jgi:hypothetical protein